MEKGTTNRRAILAGVAVAPVSAVTMSHAATSSDDAERLAGEVRS